MSNQCSVLVIEDDPLIGSMIEAMLEKESYAVKRHLSGEEGLKAVDKERPGLVLLDLGLPGISGFEVLEKLKADESKKDIPVLIFTNYSHEDDMKRARMGGAIDYIIKANVEPKDIIQRINNALDC